MATLQDLRSKAKDLGIPTAKIRKATTAPALQALIVDAVMNGGGAPAPTRKTTTRKPAPRKATTPTRKAPAKKAPARSTAPAKKAAAVKKVASQNGDAGRHVLGDDIDFSNITNWNARPGSIPDKIIKSLRKYRGDRERVFNALLPNIWDYVGRRMADGSKGTQAWEGESLRTRITRAFGDYTKYCSNNVDDW